MSFKTFIYYCALCGAWAALVAWGLAYVTGLAALEGFDSKLKAILNNAVLAGLVGLLLGAAVGTLDALLNAVGFQRVLRVVVCAAVGFFGGLLSGAVGESVYSFSSQRVPAVIGWVLVGPVIGLSIGVFDLGRALAAGKGTGQAVRKTLNGVIGGFAGGLVGGLLFSVMISLVKLPRSSLAIGLVILGACIGLLIGAAQVILKEAWVRIEAGFRAGRELILSKPETTIGRAESCDIGLFGDTGVEKLHARILLQNNRYLLDDDGTPAGTYLNGQRIDGPTPLRSGDRIGVGRAVLRFGERQKR